jgi:hypothetical protein
VRRREDAVESTRWGRRFRRRTGTR